MAVTARGALRLLLVPARLGPPAARALGVTAARPDHAPDYYAVLGLNKSATPQQVKVAYFRRAKKYHPDQNPSEQARLMFQLVAEAYEVLSDERKRRNFDEYGTAGERFGGTSSAAGGPGRARGPDNYDPEELYAKIFGEANAREKAEEMEYEDFARTYEGHAAGKEYKVTLTFEQAAVGADLELPLTLRVICPKCEGTKSAMGYTWNVCPYCEGTGLETEKVGHVLTRHPCSMCNGTAQFIKYKCDNCEGLGSIIASANQKVRIPPGSEDGQVLKYEVDERLLGACAGGHDQRVFYVYLTVEPSAHFTRDGLHLHSEADLSLAQALLGGTLTSVRSLRGGRLEVEVPPLTGPGGSLAALGQGVDRSDGRDRGHHFVRVGLRVPPGGSLTGRRGELLAALAASLGPPESGGTVDGVDLGGDGDHRYAVGVVEPDRVARAFGPRAADSTEERKRRAAGSQKARDEGDSVGFWAALRKAATGGNGQKE